MFAIVGILGTLSWCTVDLDPISMAAMVISIGFSVDIPAHVAYHYCKASKYYRYQCYTTSICLLFQKNICIC